MVGGISNSMVNAASTPAGGANAVGISVLRKGMDLQQSQNAQLLQSIPAPGPTGHLVDLYA